MAAGSIALSDRLVMRFGVKPPIVGGLSCFAIGLLWFARAPADGSFVVDVLPGMIVMGIGGGITFNPLLLAAMGDVAPTESGLASGIVNTAFMMGGALGLAVLVSVADSRTESLRDSGDGLLAALTGGYNAAFLAAAAFAVTGALGALLLRRVAPPDPEAMPEGEPAAGEPASEPSAV
jgi:MFS family permease